MGSREKELELYREMWRGWRKVKPMEPHAIEYVNRLTKFGKVFVVTVRQGFEDISNVTKWLARSGLDIDGILTIEMDSGIDKTDFCPPFNIYADDNPHTIKNVSQNEGFIYARRQPWNRDMETELGQGHHKNVMWIDSLKEMVDDIRKKRARGKI